MLDFDGDFDESHSESFCGNEGGFRITLITAITLISRLLFLTDYHPILLAFIAP